MNPEVLFVNSEVTSLNSSVTSVTCQEVFSVSLCLLCHCVQCVTVYIPGPSSP
jgi:hypothetical protein